MAPHSSRGVSCIVPAYNEAARIGHVLSVLSAHPMIGEVIVVDDGSTDGTAEVAGAFDGVTLIRQSANGGKTAALATGLEAATGDVLLLIDADLSGLEVAHVTALVRPVIEDRTGIALSLRGNAPGLWRRIGLDYISGERCFRRDLIGADLAALRRLPRFGFEVWLNAICIASRTRITVVHWEDVRSPLKSRKYGLATGLLSDAAMLRDMMQAVAPWTLVRQIVEMKRLVG